MSENSEPIDIEQSSVAALSHRRILWTMFIVALAGGLLGFIFESWAFGTGVLLGGALSLLNYFWLKNSLRGVFARAIEGERARFLATKYFLRYAAFGAILLIVFLTKSLPIISVLLGLASFAVAILIEGFIRLVTTFIKK